MTRTDNIKDLAETLAELARVFGVSRDAESPGGKGVLVFFHQALSDDELRLLYEVLAARASLTPTAPAIPAAPVELMGVREEMAKGSGFWSSCSGCYDTEDGHPTGPYSYSSVFGCALGSGCSECGGIGAVWDNTDYADMATDLDKPDAGDANYCTLCGGTEGHWEGCRAPVDTPTAPQAASQQADGAATLLDALANKGGVIVSTASLSVAQIAAARVEGRMYVRGDGCGFVHANPPTKGFSAEPYRKLVEEWSKGWPSAPQAATTASDGSIYEAVSRRADPQGRAEADAQMAAVLGEATTASARPGSNHDIADRLSLWLSTSMDDHLRQEEYRKHIRAWLEFDGNGDRLRAP